MNLREEIELFEKKLTEKCTPKEREFLDLLQTCHSMECGVGRVGDSQFTLNVQISVNENSCIDPLVREKRLGRMFWDVFEHGRCSEDGAQHSGGSDKYDRMRPKNGGFWK